MPDKHSKNVLSRRQFVTGLTALTGMKMLGLSGSVMAKPSDVASTLNGKNFNLHIDYLPVNYTGNVRQATAINGSVPAPILRWQEGDTVTINVRNNLAHDSSIHWHGIILPNAMDGVPGMTFSGIKPGATFQYQFQLQQSGTYWYHSHSGFQEQTGMYGAIVIEPLEATPYSYDRDYVVMLSDWSDDSPERIYANLKKMPHMYNMNERTLKDWQREVKNKGWSAVKADRKMWNGMRMSDRDISDVTGMTYTYLMNGKTPADGWAGLFKQGEKVLLRVINASAMTLFDVRIPGLKMTVVAADGQYIQPVTVDEFRIGVAETYDVIVEPSAEQAYTLFCQSIDRSGYARGTLTPNLDLVATVPEMDESPILGHIDMGMSHGGDDCCTPEHAAMGHCTPSMVSNVQSPNNIIQDFATGDAGMGSASLVSHQHIKMGPQVDMLAEDAQYRLSDPGIGLRSHKERYGRKVLTYADLFHLYNTPDPRQPEREIELHLTGNMSRYMWSFDGVKGMQAPPIALRYGERLRITLVNNTMMNHPIHLHGLWSDLETGDPDYIPRKHTVIVQPGSKISYLVTADAKGRWAYHCHLLYHMPGMFREVIVS